MRTASLGMGFEVGHYTDATAHTGCTVILPPPGNVAAVDIRGSSPSERELTHLDPDRKMTEIHAILLTGGSAFGLAAAGGVMDWLAERDIGYQTGIARVPIVPAAVIFDLGTGNPDVRPDHEAGRAACDDARATDVPIGLVGAGTGATVGKWAGREHLAPGGLGIATVERSGETVAALAVVNSVGDVLAPDGTVVAGTSAPDPTYVGPDRGPAPTNTVLAVVATRANLDKREVRFLASRGADGITISIRPAHTRYDGDVVFAVAAPEEPRVANLDVLGHLATEAVAAAIRAAVEGSGNPAD
ncbi:MAG TPA: P1 family peptidase [Actinomycetota bacterium]|nr:P1 family peptidase [Actinomycetota bacterium]